MAQNREPPAYQEYAAAMMGKIEYRIMRLAERGLMDTMRRECWVNHAVPSDPELLARVLGFEHQEVANALPAVMPFFQEISGRLICPELENYRAHLEERATRQSEGGKRGASITNASRAKPKTRTSKGSKGNSAGTPQPTRRGEVESLVQYNPEQPSKTQPLEHAGITDPWVAAYERESNG